MLEVLLALIGELNGAIFILCILTLFVLIGTYKIGAIKTYFTETKAKNDRIDEKIDSIKDTLASVKAIADLLYQREQKTVQSQSPITLTKIGTDIGDAISADIKINDHWAQIREKLATKGPKNPYDIQMVAMEIARDCFDQLFSKEEKDEIKLEAYKRGINLLEIYPILGVKIRDRYFKEEKIRVEEVDKHALRK
jgi:hypothetical protein